MTQATSTTQATKTSNNQAITQQNQQKFLQYLQADNPFEDSNFYFEYLVTTANKLILEQKEAKILKMTQINQLIQVLSCGLLENIIPVSFEVVKDNGLLLTYSSFTFEIKLNSMDTYDLVIIYTKTNKKETYDNMYCDQLREILKEVDQEAKL